MVKNHANSRKISAATNIQGHIAGFDDKIEPDFNHTKLNNKLSSLNVCVTEDQIKAPIIDALENYINNPSVPLHIPGHARGDGVLPKFRDLIGQKAITLDITDEFENLGTLHPADGPIAEAQKLAAQAFGAAKSFFLVNGSSVGNMALALTVARPNQKVILSRNCHRSVISGITFSGANPVWMIPERLEKWGIWGPTKPEDVEKLLDENSDAKVVWITNPTYEGIVSDTAAISKICRERDVILIVDEAHGCLWKFNEHMPTPALELGVDAVVHSIHKTGGSFSQSSILHLGKNSKINSSELATNLRMLHSTSPSYVLLASLDAARAYIASEQGLERINQAVQNAIILRENLKALPKVRCLMPGNGINIDPTKIYLMVEGLSGKRLESILDFEYNVEVEASTDNGILALSNIGNSKEEIEYFFDCLKSIVNSNYSDISYLNNVKYMPFSIPEVAYLPKEAFSMEKESVSLKKAVGRICAEVIAECPPGIPILVPGEIVKEEHLPYLCKYTSILVTKE